jgi:tripartite-type tricarboxylate transporter receptor subunit TctC
VDRRSFVIGSAAAAAAFRTSFAQDAYPTRAITVINPFPPGGAVDVVMRPLAAILEPMVQRPVVIDTKAGAAGQVGAQVAAHAKPAGNRSSPMRISFHSRVTSQIPACSSATISSRTRA